MLYISTRGNADPVPAAKAIQLGMVPAGGLFIPTEIPVLGVEEIQSMVGASYQQIAKKILPLFLEDYSAEEISECVDKAYNDEKFDTTDIAPIVSLSDKMHILELWHGPTAAFKDMALQIMPHLLSKAIKKVELEQEVVILVATSGDTGKAALEGFKNVPGIKIIVLYPDQGVSEIQKLQMVTTDGDNTYVVATKGNFDDCQSAVKEIFGDAAFKKEIYELGFEFSSANSINWGRLLPQIVYYFSAYAQLVQGEKIQFGEKVNFVVPTGNFGNILAAYYAKEMGLPISQLICASNENNVLTDFFETGVYDRKREFFKTNTPSMDIVISSNLERFLFEMTGRDGASIDTWMRELTTEGSFKISDTVKEKIDAILAAGYANEKDVVKTIGEVFEESKYTLDPHTAVAVKVYEDYVKDTQDTTVTVIDSTASPYKFSTTVMEALVGTDKTAGKDEFIISEELKTLSGMEIPAELKGLDQKPILHDTVCNIEDVRNIVRSILQNK